MQRHVCVSFCLCLVCIFFQCTYFQNIFPPGSLQAAETLLEISPVSFIMLWLPLAFFFLCRRCYLSFPYFCCWVSLSVLHQSSSNLFSQFPLQPPVNHWGNVSEELSTCERKWAETDEPKNVPWEMEANETKAEIRLKEWDGAKKGDRERERGEGRWAMSKLTFSLAVRIK